MKIKLIGLPTDINSSFERGPALAPAAIRAELFSDRGNLASESGLEIGNEIHLVDAGDLPLSEDEGDAAIIRAAVAQSLGAGETPLLLGGDHAVTFPILQGVHDVHGPVDILHFDAHPDLYDDFEGNPRSHASPFARIMEAGLAKRLVQVGIRTMNHHCREQAARFGVEVFEMRGFAPESVPVLQGPLYVSFDLDALDPSQVPGVSHPEPGGLWLRDVLDILDRQTAHIVAADIVELNPRRDVGSLAAITVAKLVREISALMVRNNG